MEAQFLKQPDRKAASALHWWLRQHHHDVATVGQASELLGEMAFAMRLSLERLSQWESEAQLLSAASNIAADDDPDTPRRPLASGYAPPSGPKPVRRPNVITAHLPAVDDFWLALLVKLIESSSVRFRTAAKLSKRAAKRIGAAGSEHQKHQHLQSS